MTDETEPENIELLGHIDVSDADDPDLWIYVELSAFPASYIDADNARRLAAGLREIADLLCYHATDLDLRAGLTVPS
jgi:hypothetical protein